MRNSSYKDRFANFEFYLLEAKRLKDILLKVCKIVNSFDDVVLNVIFFYSEWGRSERLKRNQLKVRADRQQKYEAFKIFLYIVTNSIKRNREVE